MAGGAQLSVPDMRRSTRHPVDFPVIGEHRTRGDLKLHVCNLSAHGFMVDAGADKDVPELARGDRVIIRLPVIGRIEAYCIWTTEDRAGFQFERIIRLDDFIAMISELQPNPRLRRRSKSHPSSRRKPDLAPLLPVIPAKAGTSCRKRCATGIRSRLSPG